MRGNWNSTLKNFVTEIQVCYSFHNFFDVVRQSSNSAFKTFGNMTQKGQSLFEFFNTMTQICISPHIFFNILRQNWNSTLKFFGAVRQNCFSPQKFSDAVGKICNSTLKNLALWVKIVIHFKGFSTFWEKIEFQLSKIPSLRSNMLLISYFFRCSETNF